ncbi:MAG: head decoration protein [Deltaproteobacteria bacterium]|jgi:hypothetical protein|nr:head decoration protein [Deltaproteobacteria bacterium]
MANPEIKRPVLSDPLKDEQPRYLGREGQLYNNSTANIVPLGTVVQMGSGTLEPWDMTAATPDGETIYGILLEDVPPSSSFKVGVLIAGPAAIDPNYLKWSSTTQTKIDIGLAALKNKKFIFARPAIVTGTYPEQVI